MYVCMYLCIYVCIYVHISIIWFVSKINTFTFISLRHIVNMFNFDTLLKLVNVNSIELVHDKSMPKRSHMH